MNFFSLSNPDLHKAYEELPNPHAVPVPEARKNLVLEIIHRKRCKLASLHHFYPYKHTKNPLSVSKPELNDSVSHLLNTSDTLSQPRPTSQKRHLLKTQAKIPKFHLQSLEKPLKAPKFQETRNHFPMCPDELLELCPNIFPFWQQAELLNYREIYYINMPEPYEYQQFHIKGSYKIIPKNHIAYRYEIIELIGKGAFGEVIQAFDHHTKQTVAIKILKTKTHPSAQGQTEIHILKYINSVDPTQKSNIIKLISHFEFRNHIVIHIQFLVFDLYSLNLYKVIKQNSYKGLDKTFIRTISLQVLESLKFLKKHQIIHCDIKPENILLETSNKGKIKLIDFGSSCFNDKKIYSYFQSRFYRAPEVILNIDYTYSIDIWSFGCLFTELIMGVPLFAGDSEADQLNCIMEVLGPVPVDMVLASPRKDHFFDEDGEIRTKVNCCGKERVLSSRPLRETLRDLDEDCIKVVESCLKWDPSARVSPEEAQNFDFFTRIVEKSPKSCKHRQISMDEITKNTPGLQRFIAERSKNRLQTHNKL